MTHAPSLAKASNVPAIWGLVATIVLVVVCFLPNLTASEVTNNMIVTVAMSLSAYVLTYSLIPSFADSLMKAGLSGKDLNKPEKLAKEV